MPRPRSYLHERVFGETHNVSQAARSFIGNRKIALASARLMLKDRNLDISAKSTLIDDFCATLQHLAQQAGVKL